MNYSPLNTDEIKSGQIHGSNLTILILYFSAIGLVPPFPQPPYPPPCPLLLTPSSQGSVVCPRCKATLESGAEFIAHLEAEHSFSDRAPSSDFQSQAGLGTVSGVSGEWGVWGVGCLGRGMSGEWGL